jgi:hypothetical protein
MWILSLENASNAGAGAVPACRIYRRLFTRGNVNTSHPNDGSSQESIGIFFVYLSFQFGIPLAAIVKRKAHFSIWESALVVPARP